MNSESQIIRTEYSDLMKKSPMIMRVRRNYFKALPDGNGPGKVQRRTLYDTCTN